MLDQLTQLVADVDGALGAAIGGFDGLLVEGHSNQAMDLSLLVAEHAGLIRSASHAYQDTLNSGSVREFYVRGDQLGVYALPIGEDFFLMVVVDKTGSLGQARLYGLQAARGLRELL